LNFAALSFKQSHLTHLINTGVARLMERLSRIIRQIIIQFGALVPSGQGIAGRGDIADRFF